MKLKPYRLGTLQSTYRKISTQSTGKVYLWGEIRENYINRREPKQTSTQRNTTAGQGETENVMLK